VAAGPRPSVRAAADAAITGPEGFAGGQSCLPEGLISTEQASVAQPKNDCGAFFIKIFTASQAYRSAPVSTSPGRNVRNITWPPSLISLFETEPLENGWADHLIE
jgi:hypothetical protein